MLKRIHNKLGTAGLVIAVVAMVAAVAGTAFAAGGLTKKQEKQVIKIAKRYAGEQGPQGPKGDTGAVGTQGPKGDQGPTGGTGERGPQGEVGLTGPTETSLPQGKTEIGTWSGRTTAEEKFWVNISFPLQLPEAVALRTEAESEFCPGTSSEPLAEPGSFCLYTEASSNAVNQGASFSPDPVSGMIFVFEAAAPGLSFARGTWAVTARCPIDPGTEEEEC